MQEERKLYEKLIPKSIKVEKLLLDPNNPRFCAYRRRINSARIPEPTVQERTLDELSGFGVDELKDSMLNVGYLPIDRIVAVQLTENSDYYVTIEGNRRIAAIKSIQLDMKQGLEVQNEIIKTFESLDILILDGLFYDDSSDYQLLIQGLRHISGVKSWKPYQQAKALNAIVNDWGYSVTEAAKTIGMGTHIASWNRKAFYAFEDMRKDEEVNLPRDEEEATTYFSYFVELLKNVNLRNYFGWSEDENRFTNRGEILKLYKWIGLMDIEEEKTRQIPGALDIRKLNQVLQYPDSKRCLEAGQDINAALNLCTQRQPIDIDFTLKLKTILSDLKYLPSHFVRRMTEDDKSVLNSILDIIKEHLGI